MATYPVKWISNKMRGAPAVKGVAGSLITLLDTFLIDGWGAITPTSITVSGGIATATVSAGDTFLQNSIVVVSGAAPAALDGEARVLTSSATQITFATTAPDGTATGTISIKYAPVGFWEKKYSGTNKAAYRSTHPLASGKFIRVNDSAGTYAAVCGFSSMSDVDTGTAAFNWGNYDKDSDSTRWQKTRDSYTSVAVDYVLAADHSAVLNMFDWGMAFDNSWKAARIFGFGDAVALTDVGDSNAVFLNSISQQDTSHGSFGSCVTQSNGGLMIAAPYGGGSPKRNYALPLTGQTNGVSGNDGTLGGAPGSNGVEIFVSRMGLFETSTRGGLRALVPGVGYMPQTGVSGSLVHGQNISGGGDWVGRNLVVIRGSGESFAPENMYTLVDLTGPWR